MRIQSAIANLRKVANFVSDSMKSNTAFYETTKRQFSDMQQLCNDISDMISELLGFQPTKATPPETNLYDERLDRIESAILQLCERVNRIETAGTHPADPAECNSEVIDDEVAVADVITPTESGDSVSTVTVKAKSDNGYTKTFCRDVMQKYGDVLRKMAKRKYPSEHINILTKLLWDWYNARFINNRRYNCKFRYSILRFKKLIPSIVIAYAYHMECGDTDTFVGDFYNWISLLGTDSNVTDHYATPFEIYDIEINKNSRYATETAEILYNMLYYLGLCELDRSFFVGNCQVAINQEMVASYMEVMDYDIYSIYDDFRDHLEVLDRIGLGEMKNMEEFTYVML